MFDLNNPSRKKAIKILAIGSYLSLGISVVQGLLFVPLFIHYLGIRMYGLWLGTGGIIAVLSFLDMGMASLCIQRVAREYGKKNYNKVGLYFFNGLLINLIFMVILLILGIIVSFFFKTFFKINIAENTQLSAAFLYALIGLIIAILNNTIEGTLNSLQKPLFPKITQIVGVLLGIIITYILLIKDMGIVSIPIGLLIGNLFNLLPNIVFLIFLFLKNNIPIIKYDALIIRDYLQLSPSVFLSKLGSSLVSNIEPTLITIFISPQTAVFYSVTKKSGDLVRIILDRIGGIIYPSLSHLHASDENGAFKKFIINLIKILFPVTLIGFLMVILVNSFLIEIWVGSENFLGFYMTLLISLSLMFGFFSNFSSYLISATGDVKYPSVMMFFESLLKILCLYILLRLIGIAGLPLAIFIVSFVFFIIYVRRWRKHIDLNKEEKKNLINSLLKSFFTLLIFFTPVHIFIHYFPFKSPLNMAIIFSVVFLLTSVILAYQNLFVREFVIKKLKLQK